MSDYIDNMIDEAMRFIDSLSIDELEKEFKSFGLSAIRKTQPFISIKVGEFTYTKTNKVTLSVNDDVFYIDSEYYSIAA